MFYDILNSVWRNYKWIKKQYTYDAIAADCMLIFERGEMPDWLKPQ